MKRAIFSLLGIAAAAFMSVSAPAVHAQDEDAPQLPTYTKTLPLAPATISKMRKALSANAAVAGSGSIPTWNYTVTSPIDGNTYSGTMVGASPYFNGARTTNTPTVVVPLIVKLPDGGVFDPTLIDRCAPWASPVAQLLASPIFQAHAYAMNGINMGSGQYLDEFQRANFYAANVSATGDSYHTVLSPVTTLPAQTINIPANQGLTWQLNGCGSLGVMDFNTFSTIVTQTLLPSLIAQGLVSSSTLPLLLLHNVVMADPGNSISSHCCIVGYHGAFGFPVQTYAVADFDTSHSLQNTSDITPTSHEIGEWMDDPYGTNPTPSWGHVGQVKFGCQSNLEVGDPLSGILYSESGSYGVKMPSGQTFYPQELAFFSWFYRQNPSNGAGGLYSDGGLFLSNAGSICQ